MQNPTIGECVCIHVGQAGIQMGSACWELLAAEHGVLADGTLRKGCEVDGSMNAFFNQTPSGQFVPRSILIDTEPSVVDEIRLGSYSRLFHPDLLVSGMEDAASNYARGRYTRGNRLLPILAEKIRMVVENCDRLQGFVVFDSFSGGTGTGLGANILQILDFEFHRLPRINLGVFPSAYNSPVIVDPYNSIFFMRDLIESSDIGFIIDNAALYKICATKLQHPNPSYHSLNRVTAQVISMLTSSIRYESCLNSDLNQMRTNIIPYPKFKFPILSYAPMTGHLGSRHQTLSTQDLTDAVFSNSNQLTELDLSEGFYMANALVYRGNFSVADVNKVVQYMKQQNNWVSWCPTGFKIGICPRTPLYLPDTVLSPSDRSVLMMSNSTAFYTPLHRLRRRYALMFSKKSFVHWYVGEGMEEQEFVDSYQEVFDLSDCFKEVEKNEEIPTKAKSKHYVQVSKMTAESVKEEIEEGPAVSRDKSGTFPIHKEREEKVESPDISNQNAFGDVGEEDEFEFDTEDEDEHHNKDTSDEDVRDELPKGIKPKRKQFWKKQLWQLLKRKLIRNF